MKHLRHLSTLTFTALLFFTGCSFTDDGSVLTKEQIEEMEQNRDLDDESLHVGDIVETFTDAFTVMSRADLTEQENVKMTGPIEITITGAYVLYNGTKYAEVDEVEDKEYRIVVDYRVKNTSEDTYVLDLFGSIPDNAATLVINGDRSANLEEEMSFMGPQVVGNDERKNAFWFPITKKEIDNLESLTLDLPGSYGPFDEEVSQELLNNLKPDEMSGEALTFELIFPKDIPTEVEFQPDLELDWSEVPQPVWDEIVLTREQYDGFLGHLNETRSYIKAIELSDENNVIEVTFNNFDDRNSFETLLRADIFDGMIRPVYKNSDYYKEEEPVIRFLNLKNQIIEQFRVPFEERKREPKDLGTFTFEDVVDNYGLEITVLDAYYTDRRDEYDDNPPVHVLSVQVLAKNNDHQPRLINLTEFELYDRNGMEADYYTKLDNLKATLKIGEKHVGWLHFIVSGDGPYEIRYRDVSGNSAVWKLPARAY